MMLRSQLLPETAELLEFLKKNILPIRPRRRRLFSGARQGGLVIRWPGFGGPIDHRISPVAYPVASLPGRPGDVSGMPLPAAISTDRRRRWVSALGPAGDHSLRRALTGDPTPINMINMYGKGTYSGEIESLDRDPGFATLDPGMQFPGN